MSYHILNGLLYHGDIPVFALGQSYYPSYHQQKVPVLSSGDRLGEMKKDLCGMQEAGFNICRMAALGSVKQNGENVDVRFDLPDAFLQECEKRDMAAMIRLQGYSVNLRNFEDASMRDAQGHEMPANWSWFVRNCLNHPGIHEDNTAATIASAHHFSTFPALVSFQIYNEPAYPSEGFYDYHPRTLAAFRAWLEAQGEVPFDPPHARPLPGEAPEPWIKWRLFQTDRMSDFIIDMGRCAHQGYDLPQNLTCHMSCPTRPGNAIRGEDYFATAKGMDILGITAYLVHRGPSYFDSSMQLDCAESAAASFGKRTWIIEFNARTSMPAQEWLRETYAAVGHGIKGIFYYQWRADYPFVDGPEPEGFGMLYNNGKKAPNYDVGVAMNKLIMRMGSQLVTAEKVRCGVGILFSNQAVARSDAEDNGVIDNTAQCHERAALAMQRCYSTLAGEGLVVDFTRAEELSANPLKLRILILPFAQGLCSCEKDAVEAFREQGGHVYTWQDHAMGFLAWEREAVSVAHGVVTEQQDVRSFMTLESLTAPAKLFGNDHVAVRLLETQDGCIAVLAGYDPLERPLQGCTLHLNGRRLHSAMVFATDLPAEGVTAQVQGTDAILLPTLHYGAFVIVKEVQKGNRHVSKC